MVLSVTQHHKRKSLAELGIALIPVMLKLHSWYGDSGDLQWTDVAVTVSQCGTVLVYFCAEYFSWSQCSSLPLRLRGSGHFDILLLPSVPWLCAGRGCQDGVVSLFGPALCVSKSIERFKQGHECKVNLQPSLEMQSNNCTSKNCLLSLCHYLHAVQFIA